MSGASPTDPASPIHEEATILGGLDVHRPDSPTADDRPTGVADLAEFRAALIEIGLFDETELDTLASAVPESEGVLGLARVLQQAGRLTRYQAAALYQRKSRGLLIGNYLILDKLGAGGMGMVFKARHRKLGRVVALKILPPSFARDRTAVLRFKREVEAAGRLKHPNIVAAIDADEDRGVHFLVMEYVEGGDLDHVVRHRGQLPLSQTLDFVIQTARGLEAAHAQGIVHRDIKPSNLILDGAGTVRVLDLGLARIAEESNPFGQAAGSRLTASGMYMGTVDYMAPEQAEDARKADHRADIYSLACTLYFLMTGREPFVGETVLKRLMAHQERPAPMLKGLRPDAPTPLEDVYQRMMAKRPADRPESMTDVIRLLEMCRGAVAEAPQSRAQAPKSSPTLMVFDDRERKTEIGSPRPRAGRDPSVFALHDDAQGLQVGSELNLEDLVMDVRPEAPVVPPPLPTIRRGAKPAAPALARAAPREGKRPAWARPLNLALESAAVVFVCGLIGLLVWSGRSSAPPRRADRAGGPGTGPIVTDPRDPNMSPEPPPIPIPVPRSLTIFDGKSPKGWMLTNRRPLSPRHIQADGLNPHGTGSYLVVYEKKLGDFILDFDYKLSPDCNSGVFLRVGDLNDVPNTGVEVELVDTPVRALRESGAFCDLVPAKSHAQYPGGQWNHMTITARGPVIAVSLNGTDISRINLDEWTVPGRRPDGTEHKFKNVAFARLPRSGYLGFQDLNGDCWFKDIVLTTPPSGEISKPGAKPPVADPEPLVEVGRITGHDHPFVEQVHVLRDGKRLLTTSMDGTARLWDLASGRELRRFWHPGGLRPAALHPDGRHVVTGCSDGFVRVWDLETGREERRLVKHNGRVWGVAVSPDGRTALSAGDDGILRLSDIRNGGEQRAFDHHASDWSAAFSPDGTRVLAGSHDGVVHLGDLRRNGPLVPLTGQTSFAYSVAFSPDGRHAASSGLGQLTYWDIGTKRGVKVPLDAASGSSLALTPDGGRVYYCTHIKADDGGVFDDGVIGYWDTDGRNPPRVLNRGHARFFLSLLPDGGLVTAELGSIARIWRPSRSLARARQLDTDGKDADALAEYSRLLADRPDDARLLIERGRRLYELGRSSEAEADYSRAARLAPENPQLFLDTAGWWTAGPYSPDLKVPVAFQIDKSIDPSKPAPPAGNEPRQWRRAAIEMQGKLDLRKAYNADEAAAYALAIFNCPTERDVVFLWGIDDEMAFYLNGQHILENLVGYSPFGMRLSLVRVKAGRNTILAKVVNGKGDHSLNLMISQAPADFLRAHVRLVKRWKEAVEDYQRARARDPSSLDVDLYRDGGTALGETDRWSEAVEAWRRVVELDPATEHHQEQLVAAYLGAGDLAAVSRITRLLIAKEVLDRPNARLHKEVNADLHNRLCWTIALNPEGMYGARPYVMAPQRRGGDRPEDATALLTVGAVEYRAGRFEPSVSHLNHAIKARKGKDWAFDWLFLAMARHRLMQPEAGQALARAKELAKDPSLDWYQRVEFAHLLKEAELELSVPVK